MQAIYDRYVLPRVIAAACSSSSIAQQRQKIIPEATGRILEVGVGPGKNLPFYQPDNVCKLWGIDPLPPLLKRAEAVASSLPFDVELIPAIAEALPLPDNSCDTIVSTYTLCSIDELAAVFSEFRRVLRPDGRLLFCEHGAAPDKAVRRLQNRLTPFWRRVGGGCRLDRVIPHLISLHGFEIQWLEMMYIPGWRFASFNYWGCAQSAA